MKNIKFKMPVISLQCVLLVMLLFSNSFAQTTGKTAAQYSPSQEKDIITWSNSLALQAATYGAPIVAMYLLRNTTATGPNAKTAPNTLWRMSNISTPELAKESGYVTPNANVLYGFGFMDLSQEPIILTVPDSKDRYYMVEIVDMWTNAFAYAGGVATGYKGGKFALVEPGWKGQLPADVKRIDCPTRWVELQPRVHVKDQADVASASKVLDNIKVQGLAAYTGKPALRPLSYNYEIPKINPNIASSQMQFVDPLQFWAIFSAAMNENHPPQDEIDAVLPLFKYLGIELDKPWKAENVNPLILGQMKLVSQQIGPMMNQAIALLGTMKNGWLFPPANTGEAGNDYFSRASVAVFGLTANTLKEAIYYPGFLDANGIPLTGQKNYTVTLTEPMTYLQPIPPSFWSITVYDGVTRLTVPNPINRYSLGSDNKLKKNSDGSITLYIQSQSPGKDKESNWLPTPSGPFYLILRNYAPVPAAVAGVSNPATFQGPPALIPVH